MAPPEGILVRRTSRRGVGGDGLEEARARIGRIDASLLRLLNQRASVVEALHERKVKRGERVYDTARSDAILDRLLRLNKGPLRDEQVREIFTFLLHHFALEHRPGGRPPEPPLFFAGPDAPAGAERLLRTALTLRRHGLRYLRLPAPAEASDLGSARQLCDEHGLRLVLPAADDVAAVAALADVVEAAPGLRGLAACGRAILLAGGTERDAEALRRAGAREVFVSGHAPGALAGPCEPEALVAALAAGAPGGLLVLKEDADEEALADLCHRATRIRLALRPWRGGER